MKFLECRLVTLKIDIINKEKILEVDVLNIFTCIGNLGYSQEIKFLMVSYF